jgi:hypothetical protein
MGIIINGQFSTAEGVPYNQIYARVNSITCAIESGRVGVTVQMCHYISTARRQESSDLFILSPPFERYYHFTCSVSDTVSYSGGIVGMAYDRYSDYLIGRGYSPSIEPNTLGALPAPAEETTPA